jgi:multidrug efflux pump subunit AcrB
MIRPLPIIIIAALALSLFESFLLLPNHLRHLMPAGAKPVERRWVDWVRHGYERLLGLTLRLRYVTLVAVAGLVVATVMLLQGPVKVQGSLSLTGRSVILIELSEPAESLDALAQAVAPIEALVETLPEDLQERYQTTLGRAFALRGEEILRGWKYAQIEIYPPGSFVEKEEKRAVIAERLGDQLAELETTDAFSKLRFFIQATGEVRDVVTVYVSGGDRIDFTNIQDDIRAALGEVENVKDVFMDDSRFQRSLRFVVDQKAALSYGLSEGALHAQLREAFSRQELLRLRHRGEEIEVYLGYQAPPSADFEALETLTIMTPRGVPVPIRYLGRWTETQVLRRIEHRDGLRMFQVDVLYDQEKVEAETVADAIEAQLEPVRAKNPGYFISVKPSEFEAKGRSWMLRLVLVCVALVYLCLALALNSLVQPLVVIFAIPFGFIGVVLAFWLHGMSLGIMAIIGLLGLAGVVVNDSLVMAATINDVLAEGSGDLRRAIVAGAGRRFRAVVLTSLTTLGGVFPLAYGFAGRAGWLQPMVMAVGWGLLFATLLTLLFVPCLLLIVDDGRRFGAWLLRPLRRLRRRQP